MMQKILPVISDHKSFEIFLKSDCTWCILMDFHINFIADLLSQLHQCKKKGIVHMDLLHGIANDVYGTQFMCQKLHADGIISTKAKVVECAKKYHSLAILRLFLIDSRSLAKGCMMANTIQPDYLEILPAFCKHGVERIREFTNLPLIGGGLITSMEDIQECLKEGMVAISTSDLRLALHKGE